MISSLSFPDIEFENTFINIGYKVVVCVTVPVIIEIRGTVEENLQKNSRMFQVIFFSPR